MTITNEYRSAVRWLLLEGLSVASIARRTGYAREIVERVRGEDVKRVRIGGRYGGAVHPVTLRVVPTIPAQILADEARKRGVETVAVMYSVPASLVAVVAGRVVQS